MSTGAEVLLQTLTANGIQTCFLNPGTSEMHFVAALDRIPAMRGILCPFEGVCSGAAAEFGAQFRVAVREKGPPLIEAVIP